MDHKILERAQKNPGIYYIQKLHVKSSTYVKKLDRLDKEQVNYIHSAENFDGCPPLNGIYEFSSVRENRTYSYLLENEVKLNDESSQNI